MESVSHRVEGRLRGKGDGKRKKRAERGMTGEKQEMTGKGWE